MILNKFWRYSATKNVSRSFSLFEIPENLGSLQKKCRDFAETELSPLAATLDKEQRFPKEHISKLAEMGLMNITASTQYGGLNLNMLSTAIVVEELSRCCASTGVIVAIHNILYSNFLQQNGNSDQKSQFLSQSGNGIPGAFALSEPEAGSDVSNISTIAEEDGEYYLLNGTKSWVTSAKEANNAIIFCTFNKELKHKGLLACIVPLKTEGVTIGNPQKKMGIRAVSTSTLYLNNVRIPKQNIVGEKGMGFILAMKQLDKARIGIASQAIGIAQAALETALAYSLNRKAFGQPLAKLQAVQIRLAKITARVESARLLTWKAAHMCDNSQNFTKNSAIAKLMASQTASYAAHECIQILGGMGYVEDLPAERYYRDSRVTEIYGGVSDVQMFVIADQLIREAHMKI